MNSFLYKAHLWFLPLYSILILFNGTDVYSQDIPEIVHPGYHAKDYLRSEHFSNSRSDQTGSMRKYGESLMKVKDSLRNLRIEDSRSTSSADGRNTYRYTQWYPLGPSVTTDPSLAQLGLVSALWVDTSDFKTIYAGSNTGGIFATYDGGQNWMSLSDNYTTTGVLAIDVDPEDKNHIYIGTGHWGFNRIYGQGVMESFDGGKSWSGTSLNSSVSSAGFNIQDLKVHNKDFDTLYALMNTEFRGETRIYRSVNKGKDWQVVFQQKKEELFDIVLKPKKPKEVYAVGSLFLRSFDGGSTWQDITYRLPVLPNHKISRLTLAASDSIDRFILVFAESYDTLTPGVYNQRLYKSINNGRDFEVVGIDYQPFAGYWKMELQFSHTDPSEFYLGGIWFAKYILDGDSARYSGLNSHTYHKDVREMLVFKVNGKDKIYMGNDGGISRSEDEGLTWIDITRNGFQATQFYNLSISDKGNMVYCGPQDGNLCFYNYDTKEWTKETHIGDAYDGMVDYNNPKNVYLVAIPPKLNRKNLFLLKSTDAGLSFDFRGVPDTTEQGRNNIPVAMHPKDPKVMYAGLKNVWKSYDAAENWEQKSFFNFPNQQKVQCIEISESNPDVVCISFENPLWSQSMLEKVMISINGGNSWQDITPRGELNLIYASVNDILIHPEKPSVIFLALDRTWLDRKIYVSYDGGKKWNNFSDGLPNIPINSLKYYKGAGYDIIFAATDVGVYYRDAFMTQWETFGEGLPLTIVSEIEINYGRKKLVASTFGRGLWEADLCLPLEDSALIVKDTISWPVGKNILSDVVIQPGGKFTLKGKIEIGEGRVIKVMPGAELVLNDASLINNCKTLWEGIKVYGFPDYDSDHPQGKLTMLYGSCIENSYSGVEFIGLDENGKELEGQGGGIIYTNKAYFKNNLRSIDIKPAKGINPSRFELTEFSLKNEPWEGIQFSEHVRINGSRGIEFVSCVFRNDNSYSDMPVELRGVGINSFNSSFSFRKVNLDSVPFGVGTKPMFFQLRKGIVATAGVPGTMIKVDEVTFKNNFTGAYLAGVSVAEFSNCSFELKAISSSDLHHLVIAGLYLDNCQFFDLHDNKFKGTAGSFGVNVPKVGTVINNSGSNNNLIAANTFNDINIGLLAQNTNRSENGELGLRMYFNTFRNNNMDICVTKDSSKSVNGIAYYQGATGSNVIEPAGNWFSNNRNGAFGDIFNAGEPIVYSFYSNSNTSFKYEPKYYANSWLLRSAFHSPGDSTYLPIYLMPDTLDINDQISYWATEAEAANKRYMEIKDGGNTESLKYEVASADFNTSPNLHSKLRKLDAILSLDVLESLLRNNAIHNSFVSEISAMNPILFRDYKRLQLLFERDPEIPAFMLQQLRDRDKNYSEIELLKSIADNTAALADAFRLKRIIELWLEEETDADALIHTILENRKSLSYEILSAFLDKYDTTTTKDKLNQCKTTHPESSATIDGFITLLELNNLYADTLSEENKEIAQSLLYDDNTFMHAQSLINYYSPGSYYEPYMFPYYIPKMPSFKIPPIVLSDSDLKLYPQPASDYIILEYCFKNGIDGGILEIINTSGQVVYQNPIVSKVKQEVIDVSMMIPGLYFVIVRNSAEIISQAKLVIVR